jgi:WD40 repeat protein
MSSHQPRRKRGVILTPPGWEKLQQAQRESEIREHVGCRYTLEDLSARTGLDPDTIAKVNRRKTTVDKRTLEIIFTAFNLELFTGDYFQPISHSQLVKKPRSYTCHDLTEAVDVAFFYGRTTELAHLEQWILQENCRLLALLGIGGIGKTALSVKLAYQVQEKFEYTIWRSLRHAPSIEEILVQLVQFFSGQQADEITLPKTVNAKISWLVKYLQQHRCLIVLDNLEAVLQSGEHVGYYRQGYEGYGELIASLAEMPHQSCLVLTSREKPRELAILAGETLPIRCLQLTGLRQPAVQEIFKNKGIFSTREEVKQLVERYRGNPLVLKIVATSIQELFNGNVAQFLAQNITLFKGIHQVLDQQFQRLSTLEQQILYWLAIYCEPISVTQMYADYIPPVNPGELWDALESLCGRCLIELCRDINPCAPVFTLQPVVMEYVTERIVERVCTEITTEKLALFNSLILVKAQIKEYVREIQVRTLVQLIIEKLLVDFDNKSQLETQLIKILATLRARSPRRAGYAASNILSLLLQMQTDLSGYDFSELCVWQSNLKGANLHNVNFTHADLAKSIFTETFAGVLSVATSQDGKLIACSDTNGDIHLWQVEDGTTIETRSIGSLKGHTGWIRSVEFSPDCLTLASGSSDHTIKIWDIKTGQCLKTLQGYTNRIRVVAFSPQGHILVSGSDDFIIKVWDACSGQCLKTWKRQASLWSIAFHPQGTIFATGSDDGVIILWDAGTGKICQTLRSPTSQIRKIAFSPDGQILASCGEDRSIRLWDINTGKCLKVFSGHTTGVWSIAFSPQGNILASSGHDGTIHLWDISTARMWKTLVGHTNWILSVAFTADGRTCVSGSLDRAVKLWDTTSGQCIRALCGHSNGVWAVTFNPKQGNIIASVSDDLALRLWDIHTGQALHTLRSHSNGVWSVAFSPDSQTLASGSDDRTVHLWDISGGTGKTLLGHTAGVWSVAFSPVGKILASSGADRTIRLWDVDAGETIAILSGHTNTVREVAFSSNGEILASGSIDLTIRLWDVSNGQTLAVLEGHTQPVSSVSFDPQGNMLASGSDDGTVKLWAITTGQYIQTLQGHSDWVQSVAFSPDGQIVASGSHDRTVKLWDICSGKILSTLTGHEGWIWSVAFSPDGTILASSSQDGTIKVWDICTGECLTTLRSARPYEGMNITGATGLTVAQKATLKALGAVEFTATSDHKIIPINQKSKGRSVS